MTPQRIQRKRTKGWRKPENTILVSRPHVLGSPFVVAKEPTKHPTWSVHYVPNPAVDCGPGSFVDEFDTRKEAIQCAVDVYREWATEGRNHYLRVMYFVEEHKLRGKNLGCWCPLDQPCHADVLLELANGSYPTPIASEGGGAVVGEVDSNHPTAEGNVSRNPTDPYPKVSDKTESEPR